MARMTFMMIDVAEILEHWYGGRRKVKVAVAGGLLMTARYATGTGRQLSSW